MTPLTVIEIEMARIDRTGAETQIQNAVFGIQSTELGHCNVLCPLGDRVQRRNIEIALTDHVEIGMASRQHDDLFGLPLFNQRGEQVEQVNIADDVNLDVLEEDLLHFLGLVCS